MRVRAPLGLRGVAMRGTGIVTRRMRSVEADGNDRETAGPLLPEHCFDDLERIVYLSEGRWINGEGDASRRTVSGATPTFVPGGALYPFMPLL